MTPSSRVSAINLVGDLLRKVGVSNTVTMLAKLVAVIMVALITVECIISL